MSYAGPASRSRNASSSGRPAKGASSPSERPPRNRSPRAAEPLDETDWAQVAIFGAGLALGILVGAGATLLTAPRSGAETRAAIAARARRTRRGAQRRTRDAWDDLRHEIRSASRALRRRKQRRELEVESEYE